MSYWKNYFHLYLGVHSHAFWQQERWHQTLATGLRYIIHPVESHPNFTDAVPDNHHIYFQASCFWMMDHMVRPVNSRSLSPLFYFLASKVSPGWKYYCIRYHGRALVCPSIRKCIGQEHQNSQKSLGSSPPPSPRSSWPDRKVKQSDEGDHLYLRVIIEITHLISDGPTPPSGLNNAGTALFSLRSGIPLPFPAYKWITTELFRILVTIVSLMPWWKECALDLPRLCGWAWGVSRLHINDVFLYSQLPAPSKTFLYSRFS